MRLSERLNAISSNDNGSPTRSNSAKDQARSIVENIANILNTRVRSVPIDLDFGIDGRLLDINFSKSEERLHVLSVIRTTLLKHEKRLAELTCVERSEQSRIGYLVIDMSGLSKDQLQIRGVAKLHADKTFEVEVL